MDFIEVTFVCDQELKEILMAELANGDFDSFLEDEISLKGYIKSDLYDGEELSRIEKKYQVGNTTIKTIPEENWNQIWEKQYEPVIIGNRCRIVASFHQLSPDYEYEILINPQMSFGTGHHETTSLMIGKQLELNFKDTSVLDVGCGTGILSILAERLGAAKIVALDIDPIAVRNTKENALANNCQHIAVFEDSMETIGFGEGQIFDFILANINRNVLIKEIELYAKGLSDNGSLLISGFYTRDIDKIVDKGIQVGLSLIDQGELNQWAALIFGKNLA
ncbi:MAG: 50S ribosomal protein L11 methyltransferase [Cyclobacteriaceae bacterium]